MDWYKKYEISTSNDGISFNSKFEIEIVENPQKKSYYYELHDLKPGSFIKITPSKEYLNDKDNYAFYGVEFFGEIYHNFQNSYPQNQFHYTFLFSIYTEYSSNAPILYSVKPRILYRQHSSIAMRSSFLSLSGSIFISSPFARPAR